MTQMTHNTPKKVQFRIVQLDSDGNRKVETPSKDLKETIRRQVEFGTCQ